MLISNWILFLLLLIVHASIQKSRPASATYRAAVVEYNAVFHENDMVKTLNDNAKKFLGYIELAAKENVDIIVFPVLGLSSLVLVERAHLVSQSSLIPDTSQNYTPCTNSSIPVIEAINKIACAAEESSIYVVVNLLEKKICSGDDCPSDGVYLYITSVVFDRKGKIVARYRKGQLLEESGLLDAIKTPELSTFDTDFGVTFGNIMCFDIMYHEPLLTLTRELNITDIIFTSGWSSEMPFLTTIQIEAGWAYIEDVNMLASGLNKIERGNSGSGIYAGRQGVVSAILPLNDHEEMLVAEVWKKPNKIMGTLAFDNHNEDHLRFEDKDDEHHADKKLNHEQVSHNFQWRYEKLDAFKTKLITGDGLILQKLNHGGINCTFQVNVINLNSPLTYRLVAFDGQRTFGNSSLLGTRVCAIVQCANDTIDSCGHMQNSSAVFNQIAIKAIYVDNQKTVILPSTLRTDMLPLRKWNLKEKKYGDHISTSISLTAPTDNLVTFGIWGRNFEKDEIWGRNIEKDEIIRHISSNETSSASTIFHQISCLSILLVLLDNVSSLL